MAGTRTIAAILVADIVGYSRLAEADEEPTLARLRALRSDLIDPAIDRAVGRRQPLVGIERFAFYERGAEAFAIVATGERRHYGCFIFKKGVLPEE